MTVAVDLVPAPTVCDVLTADYAVMLLCTAFRCVTAAPPAAPRGPASLRRRAVGRTFLGR